MDMIYAGTDLKFRIKNNMPSFSLSDDYFYVTIKDWMGNEAKDADGRRYGIIPKGEMFEDSDGNWYFTVENVSNGRKLAQFVAEIPDDDYDKGVRIVKDVNFLCAVGICIKERNFDAGCPCVHQIEYEQVWEVNLDDGSYLCDVNGNLILTSDGKRIQFSKK